MSHPTTTIHFEYYCEEHDEREERLYSGSDLDAAWTKYNESYDRLIQVCSPVDDSEWVEVSA